MMEISGMATAKRTAPAWGGYKKPNLERTHGTSSDAGFFGVSVPEHFAMDANGISVPAFNIHAVMQESDDAFAPAERDEEEFEELGEGAFRQIGRSFLGILGTGASLSAIAALAMWALPGSESDYTNVAGAGSEIVSAPSTLQAKKDDPVLSGQASVQVALQQEPDYVPEVPVTEGGQKSEKAIKINVELPIPVVLEKADETSKEQGSSFYAVKHPGPVPIAREYAMTAMLAADSGVIAQGSDQEWATEDQSAVTASREWVSVMIPKPRPVF